MVETGESSVGVSNGQSVGESEGSPGPEAHPSLIDLRNRGQFLLGILEFITGVDEIFDLQVLPNIRRGDILAPHQWFEQPSIVTMKGGM